MKLSKKIYYCRKKSGKSQEALAEVLGVSRQAVSKWETGDAEPEIGKLKLLAETFGVSVDWLLSDDEPEDAADYTQPDERENPALEAMEAVPGFLGRMLKKFGWIYGVYVALSGAGLAIIGALAKYISESMLSGFGANSGGSLDGFAMYDQFGQAITDQNLINQFAQQAGITQSPTVTMVNPVAILGGAMMVIGILTMIAGTVLAVWLKKKSEK